MNSSDKPLLIFTCEHAGNDVPEEYKHLFKNDENVLLTHQGFDIGALEIGRYLSDALKADLYYTTISRLLVEANRSVHNNDLFSKYSEVLGDKEKEHVLETYYYPYRNRITETITGALKSRKVIHLSMHSFTPVLNGKVRDADIGILYDPDRSYESHIAESIINEIREYSSEFKVLPNSPYKGIDDGFTTYLRTITDERSYAGIEIEINQKFFTDMEEKLADVKTLLLSAIRRTALSERNLADHK